MVDEAVVLSRLKEVLAEAKKGTFAEEILAKRKKEHQDKIVRLIKDLMAINPGGDKTVTDIIDALKKLLEESVSLSDEDLNEISSAVSNFKFLEEMTTYESDDSDSTEVMDIIKESEQIKNLIYEYDDRYEFSKTGRYHDPSNTKRKNITRKIGHHIVKIKKYITDFSKAHPYLMTAAKYASVIAAIEVADRIRTNKMNDEIRGIHASHFAKDAKKFLPK